MTIEKYILEYVTFEQPVTIQQVCDIFSPAYRPYVVNLNCFNMLESGKLKHGPNKTLVLPSYIEVDTKKPFVSMTQRVLDLFMEKEFYTYQELSTLLKQKGTLLHGEPQFSQTAIKKGLWNLVIKGHVIYQPPDIFTKNF